MGKRRNFLSAWVLTVILLFAGSIQAIAAEWDDLKGESTVNSQVYTKDGNRLWTTIQTNFHAGGVTGLVVQTTAKDMEAMLGITSEEAYMTDRPILYVAGSVNGDKYHQFMKDQAATLGGTTVFDLQINLFRWWNSKSWMETIETTSKAVKIVIGIDKKNVEEGYSFGLIHYNEGTTDFVFDTDADPGTLTVDLSDFRGTYMLIKYPSANTPSGTGSKTGGSNTSAPGNAGGELDDVPKTGDVHMVTLAVLFVGSVLLCGTAVVVRRKMNV